MSGPVGAKSAQDKSSSHAAGKSQRLFQGSRTRGSHVDIFALQRAAGNSAVAHLLQPAAKALTTAEDHVPTIVRDVLNNGAGQALDAPTLHFMESRFGQDFGHVRVHTDENAGASAQTLGAAAYTVGQHIMFGSGWYAPSTSKGQHVLAHELAHVVQQRNMCGVTTPGVNAPADEFETAAESATSLVTGKASEEGSSFTAVGHLLSSSSQAAPPAVQRMTLQGSSGSPSVLTPQRGRRASIPDEVKAEMIRQIIAIRDRWAGRFHALKGSEIEIVVNLVWEYAQKGQDAARSGQGSPSDWVDTLIELMSTAVYDRGAVIADYANLWDDALEHASRDQRIEITKYLSHVNSQYVSYAPPDRSKDPSFFGDVAAPVGWKALELFSMGIVDETLFQVSSEAAKKGFGNQLFEIGKLLVRRVSGILTFGGAPSAYDAAVAYQNQHPNDPLGISIAMSIAAGGEGFVRGLVDSILPLEEVEILTGRRAHDATVWQKMEKFFSALLKVVSLGEMAKGRGSARKLGGAEPPQGAAPIKEVQSAGTPASEVTKATGTPLNIDVQPPVEPPRLPEPARTVKTVESNAAATKVPEPAVPKAPARVVTATRRSIRTHTVREPIVEHAPAGKKASVAPHPQGPVESPLETQKRQARELHPELEEGLKEPSISNTPGGEIPGLEPSPRFEPKRPVKEFTPKQQAARERRSMARLEEEGFEPTRNRPTGKPQTSDVFPHEQTHGLFKRGAVPEKVAAKFKATIKPDMPDPAFPKRKMGPDFEIDHIVAEDRARREIKDLALLDRKNQLKVLNREDNLQALSKSANASKGNKSFLEWKRNEELGLDVDENWRNAMIKKENELIEDMKKQVEELLKEQMSKKLPPSVGERAVEL
jgi:uncharacterized protein DUF4157